MLSTHGPHGMSRAIRRWALLALGVLLLAAIAKDLATLPDDVRTAYGALYDALSRGRA